MVKTYTTEEGRTELRAVTGQDYGRIHDHELVEAVMRIAGNGTGDTRWKVPGVLDWSTMVHNPQVDITKDTTTLYASVPLTDAEEARLEALREEMAQIEAKHAGAGEDLPEDVDRRLAELEAEIAALDERPGHFEAEAIACCEAYVSLGHDGRVRIDRGYMREEDELSAEPGTDNVRPRAAATTAPTRSGPCGAR